MKQFKNAIRYIEYGIREGIFPSAVLAIGVHEDLYICEARGVASIQNQRPADIDTLYDMASLSKILSPTMIALKLVEAGKLCLSDTIGFFFGGPEDKRDIRVFDLMTHTSGMSAGFLLQDAVNTPEKALDAILDYPLQTARGKETIYSDIGYILLGRILEKICEAPLDIIANRYVFAPLDMRATGYRPQGDAAATEFDPKTGICLEGIVHDENARFLHGISGHAGVFSNIGDCIKFASMLSNMGKGKTGIFLSGASIQKAITNHTKGKSQNRGLGFKLAGGDGDFIGDLFPECAFGHTGFTGTSIVVDPKTGLYVVLLTNRVHPSRENNGIIRFRKALHNIVMAEYTS